jgi:hypothetical protein
MAIDRDIELLRQNLLMEHRNADSALAAACRIIAEADGYIDHYRDRCSYGFIYRRPRKQAKPLILDSVAALVSERTESPHG